MRLRNKIAVITGAATGIGRAAAVLFAQEGAVTIIGDINDEEAKTTLALIEQAGGHGRFIHCDVSRAEDVEHLISSTVTAHGRIDVLFNNVGIDVQGRIDTTSEETWAHCMNVNLAGIFRGMKYALPHMMRQEGGSIISTASIQGLVAFEGYAAYAAAKGAVIQLTRQVAYDFARYKIRVNCICPGTVRTPMTLVGLDPENVEEGIASIGRGIPLGRIGEPEDIAAAALYLAADESAWVTGHALVVDGGMIIRGE